MESAELNGMKHKDEQRQKRKRLEPHEGTVSPKKQRTDEAMATFMTNNNDDLISGMSPPNGPPSDRYHSAAGGGIVSVVQSPPTRAPWCLRGAASSVIVEGPDVPCGGRGFPAPLDRVSIRVTPATPPLSEPSTSLPEEVEPMEQMTGPGHAPRHTHSWKKNWDVILEDLSSDSSDGTEPSNILFNPQQVWLAPELQSLTVNNQLLLPQVLEEMHKKALALVPWVEPERRLHGIVAMSQMAVVDHSTSDTEDTQSQENTWDCTMLTD